MSNNWKKNGLLFVAISLLITGCGSKEEQKNTDVLSEKEQSEQIFKIAVQQEMPSADMSLATDTISFSAFNNIYEGLYRLDDENNPQPAGAKQLAEKSEDGLTYTFKLREDAKWSNGDPVVAQDYVYGWRRTVNPQTGGQYAFLYNVITNGEAVNAGRQPITKLGIEAIGDYELQVTLVQETPYFDYLLALPPFFPQNEKVAQKYGDAYTTKSDASVYNGPFTLTDFEGPGTDTEWSYTKNEAYWDADNVQLEKILVKVVKESPTALNLFQDGQVDDIILSGELAKQMADDPELVIEKESRTVYLEFNQQDENSPYRNENLRKAISYAIDREAVVDSILGDGCIASTGLIPAEMAYSPKDGSDFIKANNSLLAYDKEQAKKYWEQAQKELGTNNLKIDILSDDTDSNKKVAEYIQGSLKETFSGMDITVTSVPFSVRLDREKVGDFEIVLRGWGADYADPSTFMNLFTTGNSYNRGKYSDVAYDKLVEKANTVDAADSEKRWDDFVQSEKLLLKHMGVSPIYQKAEAHLRNEKIQGVVAHGSGARYDYKWTYVTE